MDVILTVCSILVSVLGLLYAYRAVFLILGLFITKKYEPAKQKHRYAVVIAARNEESVLGNLLDSIAKQDYPADLITTFVVADNCTDATARIAREHGAVCYERFDQEHRTKGYALRFLFEEIRRDYGIDAFEGYIVFDADNLLKQDYISRMNDSFDAGERIIVSYRNTKNINDGWIASGYALHWLRTARMEHCARSYFGVSARIQGTGFLFGNEFVQDGWNYVSLTEDRAFSSVAVVQGATIAYNHEAQFYDEQPNDFGVACRQRLRWARGNLEAFVETFFPLIRGIFRQKTAVKKFSSYDMLMNNFPFSAVTVPLKLVEVTIFTISFFMAGQYGGAWIGLLWQIFRTLLFEHFSTIWMGAVLFFTERKRLQKVKWYRMVFDCLMFPMFGIIGDVVTLIAIFKKVSWTPIPHTADVRIEELNQTEQAPEKEETPVP